MPLLTTQPTVLVILAVCAIAAVAASTGSRVAGVVRNRRQRSRLARALAEVESIKRFHDHERQTLNERLTRIEHALDVMAVEMERVGEGQRFVTRLLSPRAPDGRSAADER